MTRVRVVLSRIVAPPLLLIGVVTAIAWPVAGAGPEPGSQGTDTALAPTDSAVTVRGRGPFSDLRITVNQTSNLTNQAVSVTWTGGRPTISGPGRFAGNYLQVFQCWSDEPETIDSTVGPPPEQCAQGATAAVYGGVSGAPFPSGYALSRIISRKDWLDYDPAVGVADPVTNEIWMPFRAVDGTVVNAHTNGNFNPSEVGGQFWLNPYFNIVTTNEIAGGVTGPDGRGAELFEVHTGIQSAGLGCGQRVLKDDAGQVTTPQCWIVVVPRGTPSEENVGASPDVVSRPDQFGVFTSPLSPGAWQHRIAIPIDFNPVDPPCSLSDVERRISGNEIAFQAVESWQPLLCAGGELPPFSYAPVGDTTARQQIANPSTGAAGMAVFQRPLDAAQRDPDDPVVYAPLTASGLVIGFNVERTPKPSAPDAEQSLQGVRIASINLTPRLVAKLLTQSYVQSVSIVRPPDYDWLASNAFHLGNDPDFVQFNPEFAMLDVLNGRPFSGLQLPVGNSDAAAQVWEWVLSDVEARAWLDGNADEWGMVVNPIYSTNPEINPTGYAFGAPTPESFPKADPYCYQAVTPSGASYVPPALCGTDWIPYVRSLSEAAQITRAAADRPRIVRNPFAQSASEAWSRELPQQIGQKTMLALTDTASAHKFGLQTARLSRAGDGGKDREFIDPTDASLSLGLDALESVDDPAVLEPVPTVDAPGAYPLTVLSYAAVAPLSLDQQARDDYAAFLEYALGPGQVQGQELGLLPAGYVPLPEALRTQGLQAADKVRTLTPPPAEPPSPPDPPPATLPTVAAPPPTSRAPSTRARAEAAPDVEGDTAPTTEPSPPDTTQPVDDTEADEEAPTPTSVSTAKTKTGPIRYVVPSVGIASLGAALAALEITKRPRRAAPDASTLTGSET